MVRDRLLTLCWSESSRRIEDRRRSLIRIKSWSSQTCLSIHAIVSLTPVSLSIASATILLVATRVVGLLGAIALILKLILVALLVPSLIMHLTTFITITIIVVLLRLVLLVATSAIIRLVLLAILLVVRALLLIWSL